ncbi:MAG TPA: ABC transporter permease [Terriglobales bacterium]|jgi:lipopolysaccharide transport system permease protein|nr:ABC transporter permease [Terriglobales bacterium]
MRNELRELYKYRELLVMIAVRDIKVRYKQSLMGFFWAILMPVLIVASGILVRYGYAIASHKPLDVADLVSVAIKSVPWAFLVSSVRFSSQSLIGNQNLVTKVYFPKEIFPMAAVLSQLFDLCIASSVLAILLMFVRLNLGLRLLWAGPLLATVVVLAVGIGLLVSAGSLFYRDVKYIVEVFLTFAIFFTPVFYDVDMFGPKGRWLLLNPIAPLLEGFSSIVYGRAPDWNWLIYSVAFALFTLIFAYFLFKKIEPEFAQSI